jgi:hypothetical protein
MKNDRISNKINKLIDRYRKAADEQFGLAEKSEGSELLRHCTCESVFRQVIKDLEALVP